MRSILITGCSSGLGAALARQCVEAGWSTYGTVRKPEDAAALEEAGVIALMCDVRDAEAVSAAVARVVEDHGRIDALVANAAVGYVRSTEQVEMDEMQDVMDINFWGVVRCVKAALPHMRARKAGRIVGVTSVGGLVGQPFGDIYCASKFAIEGYFESLAAYAGVAFGIDFTLVEPGGISSDFAKNVLARMEETGGIYEDDYAPLLQRYMTGGGVRGESVFQTPDQAAEVVRNVLEMDSPPLRIRTSDWARDLCHLKTAADPTGLELRDKVVRMMMGEDLLA